MLVLSAYAVVSLSITECLLPGWNQPMPAHLIPVRQVRPLSAHLVESVSQFN